MNDYRAFVENDYNSIYHFGIKGQKWGVRRYQNEDGTLTEEGKRRYFDKNGNLTLAGREEVRRRLKIRTIPGHIGRGIGHLAVASAFGNLGAAGLMLGGLNFSKRHVSLVDVMAAVGLAGTVATQANYWWGLYKDGAKEFNEIRKNGQREVDRMLGRSK